MKIEKLTKQQEDLLPIIRDKWLKIGLSTEPADWKLAEEGIRLAYKTAKLKTPKFIVKLESPLAGVIGTYLLSPVGSQVESQVRSQVWSQVESQVRSQVWSQVRSQVESQVRSQVWSQVRSQVESQSYPYCYGQHEASWLGYYDFFRQIGLECTKPLIGLTMQTMAAGWWLPYSNVVVLTDRPKQLYRDGHNLLHSESGMAVEYRDGWGVYVWHGVRVPEFIIKTPESITIEQIEKEDNVEVRRIMLERYGPADYLKNSGSKLVHKDRFGELYRKELVNDEHLVMVKVRDSTRIENEYFIRVPPQIEKAHDAVAWTYGIKTEDYTPTVET